MFDIVKDYFGRGCNLGDISLLFFIGMRIGLGYDYSGPLKSGTGSRRIAVLPFHIQNSVEPIGPIHHEESIDYCLSGSR